MQGATVSLRANSEVGGEKPVKNIGDENSERPNPRGLDKIVADWTRISFVDGAKGSLTYRGINIAELAAESTFEECAYLLLSGRLPTTEQLQAFCWKLRHLSPPADKLLRIVKELPPMASPLSVLQVALASLSCMELGDRLSPEETLFENAMRIIAQTPAIIAAAHRHERRMPLISPLSTLNHAENFFYMLTGQIPSKKTSQFLEIALIAQMDHGFNPSTFAARTVASTLSDIFAATSAAVGSLAGPLHGGASSRVVEMVLACKEAGGKSAARDFVQDLLNRGQRVMGMGHRIYVKTDPRARILEDVVFRMSSREDVQADYELLKAIESAAHEAFKERGVQFCTNIDFWTGTLYRHLGLEKSLYPAIFAAARVVGWCAHILELRQANRLYRPQSEYRGLSNVAYVPIEERNGPEPK